MNVGEAKHFTGLVATQTVPFVLKGGRYAIMCDIGDIDTVSLQTLVGAVWYTVPSLQVAPVASGDGGGNLPVTFNGVDGMFTADCPPGSYRFALTGADTDPAANVSIVRIQ